VAGGRGTEALPLTAEGVVGAVVSIVNTRLQADDSGSLSSLLGPLIGVIVLPYLGVAAARRELARPAPEPSDHVVAQRVVAPDPLAGLKMRITYRTLCVLNAIAARPGVCNREVGEDAGVSDPGQISKLLSRLRTVGLVENQSPDAPVGGINSWLLTQLGEQVWRATMPADGDQPPGWPPSATSAAESAPRNGVSAK
jgi:hypothetical protein